MDRLQSRNGFTLVESLLALIVMILISEIGLGIVKTITKSDVNEVSQIDVFDVQVRQLLIRSSDIEIDELGITFNYDNQKYTITKDGSRLVKKPGYEILLTEVESFNGEWVCDKNKCIEIKTR